MESPEYLDNEFVEMITLKPGESPELCFNKWLAQLPTHCARHPEEALQRDEDNTGMDELASPEEIQHCFGALRRALNEGVVESTSQAELPHSARHYRLRARFHPCGQCHLAYIGVPPRFLRCSFENFETDTDELRHNLAKCREYADGAKGFLFLLGLRGSGKTHLSAAVLRARLYPKATGSKLDPGLARFVAAIRRRFCNRDHYFRHLDLINRLRASYHQRLNDDDDEADVRTLCQKAPLLVIDEIGVAGGGNDAQVLLYDILDHRYTHLRPTVLCSNLTMEEFKSFAGERLADRFREAAFAILNFNAASRRASLNADYLARCKP